MRLKSWHLALLLPAALLLVALKEPAPLPIHPYFSGQPEFLVIAHRGGRGLGPEEFAWRKEAVSDGRSGGTYPRRR